MVFGIRKQIHRARLVNKNGRCNIKLGNVSHQNKFAFVKDYWTGFMELSWYSVIFIFCSSYTLTWLLFALLYYWSAWANGDIHWQNAPLGHKPCIWYVDGMVSAYLYSLETQTTIGYGVRCVSPLCPSAVTLVIIQALFGGIFQALMCGAIITKLKLPKNRAKTIKFSDNAVICPKNDFLCLMIRVANLRKTLMIGSKIYGKLLRTTDNPEGKSISMDQVNIEFMVDSGKDDLFFVCPVTLYHVIDKTSPFFETEKDTLHKQEFELVVFLDGKDEYTGTGCQVRTSFIPQEILWGYNFLPIISRSKKGKYIVDYSKFSEMLPVDTAHCAYCHQNNGQHFHSVSGIDNCGFESIDIGERHTMTKM